ncbi:Nuclear LIM factor interactor-interacting protein cleavage-specific form, partial [Phytophthora palmivora]
MMTTQSKTLPSLNVSLKPEGIATGNPVQVSKQLADLSIANPLASIVHQADKNGKQQPILTGLRRDSSSSTKGQHRGSFRNIFVNIWSALGSHEQPQDLDKTNQRRSSLSKPKTASVSKEIQLRPNLLPSVSPDDANK